MNNGNLFFGYDPNNIYLDNGASTLALNCVKDEGDEFLKHYGSVHREAGTPNGIGAVTFARAHKFLFEEIGEAELERHTAELNKAIRDVTPELRKAGYDVYFTDTEEMRTPILIVDNKKKTNKQTVEELNNSNCRFSKNVFVREGAFCAYRLIEELKPELKEKQKIVDGHLNDDFSLIRLSAGFINDADDIRYAADKLIEINSR